MKYLLFCTFLVFCNPVTSQYWHHFAPSGTLGQTNNIAISSSIGQPFIQTQKESQYTLSEGFHQVFSQRFSSDLKINDLNIYPNPSTGRVIIACDKQIISFKVLSIDGRLIEHYKNTDATSMIETSINTPGVYIIKVSCSNGQTLAQRTIII